jgi:hypothetical protein
LQQKRINSIDFWRGVALAVILVNHIPGNVLGMLTPRNFAFSDAAELFVFLSGVSVYLAYGERFALGWGMAPTLSLLRRAGRLYGAHICLTMAALALFGLLAFLGLSDLLFEEDGRIEPFLDPASGIAGILALTHQLAYFNILPLYVLLLSAAPLLLFLARRDWMALLAGSIAVYAGSRAAGLNLPSWPGHSGWYFNPFAWQLMFALGIVSGHALRTGSIPYSRSAGRLALAVKLSAALVVSNAFGLAPGLVDAAGAYLDWDKTNLGVVRIFDFLALAYAVNFSRLTVWLEQTRAFGFFSQLGRNALATFCFGSLLSALGEALGGALSARGLASPAFDIVFVAGALALLHRLACRFDRRNAPSAPAPLAIGQALLGAPGKA